MNNIEISIMLSYLGYLFLNGNIDSIKYLYQNIWMESPPLVRTISELQDCLTSAEIENDRGKLYSAEFLYYWAMTCIGEQSPLIFKDLGTAKACLESIQRIVPMAQARLAYIELLQSTESARSSENVARMDVLRRWANKHDLFSRIVLAKIIFYSFLQEAKEVEADVHTMPLRVKQLLEFPCQQGHPVAIRFWNDVCSFIGAPGAMLDASHVNPDVLFDFKTSANMQIGPQTLQRNGLYLHDRCAISRNGICSQSDLNRIIPL